MGISQYIKIIGRGKDGARPLSRSDAADLMGQVLDGTVTDLEVGAFCLAMRIKGETPQEMAGFIDATRSRMQLVPADPASADTLVARQPIVVLPTYNGARKLPGLVSLLGLLVARAGLPVLMHGTPTESSRVFTSNVLDALEIRALTAIKTVVPGELVFAPTELLCPALKRLLDVRRTVGLRNPAHSLVKLIAPCEGPSLVVASYTHPEYAVSMAETFELMRANALLLRGCEGEVVADARRMPAIDAFIGGERQSLQAAEPGSLQVLPDLPLSTNAVVTAQYVRAVLAGEQPVPRPIARQVECILQCTLQISQIAQHVQNPAIDSSQSAPHLGTNPRRTFIDLPSSP
jgi:anthranilate phosphoribosyltransferase